MSPERRTVAVEDLLGVVSTDQGRQTGFQYAP